jgi:hypothetical protein
VVKSGAMAPGCNVAHAEPTPALTSSSTRNRFMIALPQGFGTAIMGPVAVRGKYVTRPAVH